MELINTLKSALGIGKKIKWDGWKCDWGDSVFGGEPWVACPHNENVPWGKYMSGDRPTLTFQGRNYESCIRLMCEGKDGNYRTQGLWTKGKKLFGPGRLEVKARFKGGAGSWPAVWLRNISCQDPNNWKQNYYEIDMVEYYGKKIYSEQTFHTEDSMLGKRKPHRGYSLINKNDWNTFVAEWDKDHVMIWVNDQCILDVKSSGFPTEYYLILSMQYGHGATKDSELPLWMDIAYVKHYIKK